MKIKQIDAIKLLHELADNSVDLIFVDPPYALGSEIIIRKDGKPDYKKAVDFMNKWDQPDGKFWEEWFKEANRVLKYGGRVLMFGMDRQLMLNKYYACFAGLQEQQSLYWYFASSFPKASDLSKNLDKYFGEDREVVGKYKLPNGQDWNLKQAEDEDVEGSGGTFTSSNRRTLDITKGTHSLAQKYDGFKYSISPLKQTNETIMVFQKPYKTGSCLHDTLAYENGDNECCCGALNIDDNRVGNESRTYGIKGSENLNKLSRLNGNDLDDSTSLGAYGQGANQFTIGEVTVSGRFPAQSFVDSETAKLLDEQSGISKSSEGDGSKFDISKRNAMSPTSLHNTVKTGKNGLGLGDIGGCSKILHKCDYDEKDIELYYYCPKVDKKERNMGNIDNNHPTVKPISLLLKILNLFKTPNPQVCVDTFAGSGSIPIAAKLLGFEVIAGDLNEGFVEIANARLDYAIKNKTSILKKHKQPEPIKPSSTNQSFF